MDRAESSFGGSVKWAAVGVLSAAAVGGLALALFFRQPRESLSRGMPQAPRGVQPDTPSPAATTPTQASAPSAGEPRPTPDTPPKPKSTGRLNVNTASAAELELLPGIGPELAQRIIEHRTQHGMFESLKDLDGVRGIGPKTLRQLEPLIVFE